MIQTVLVGILVVLIVGIVLVITHFIAWARGLETGKSLVRLEKMTEKLKKVQDRAETVEK